MVVRILTDNKKNQTKAMKIAAGISGVETVALQGEEKNQLIVIGDAIDAVSIATMLRKKLGFAQLISVVPYYDEMEDCDEEDYTYRPTVKPIVCSQQPYYPQMPPYYIHDFGMNNHDNCVIL